MFSIMQMEETDIKTSGDKLNLVTSKGKDGITGNENIRHKDTRNLRWDKKRPDTPMTNENIKLEWRRTHSSDSVSTNSSCPNSGSLPNSGCLEDNPTAQSEAPSTAIILKPLVSPTSNNSSTKDTSGSRGLNNNDGKSFIISVSYFHFSTF